MGIFNRQLSAPSTDCTDIAEVIQDQHEGNRGAELVFGPDGEMMAVPASQVDSTPGVKATEIAKKDYYGC